MREFGYMEDVEHSIESNVFTQYLYSFDNETSESEKIEKLAKKFKLSEEKVAMIVKSDNPKNENNKSSF